MVMGQTGCNALTFWKY